MKLTKSAKVLLVKSFNPLAWGVPVNAGTPLDWATLEFHGLVRRMQHGRWPKAPCSFCITDKGRAKIKDLLSRIDGGTPT